MEEVHGWVDDGPEFCLDITGVDTTFGSLDDRPEKPVFEKAMKYGVVLIWVRFFFFSKYLTLLLFILLIVFRSEACYLFFNE